ncbi:hypothetical protein NST39_16350 [Bacillus sp. FSL W8-0645]|uniref:hypothetical protein n=2 Tax=Bacillus sp. FSL W8-0645 TaxID=2954627 RepID=UPI0030F71067
MIGMKMAHFWHDLGKAFCLRAVMMVLGDKLRAASIVEVAFYMEVLAVVEVTVISMERHMKEEVEELYRGADLLIPFKRVPYVVVNAEIKHKGNMIKSEYTFFDAEDMSFKEAQERIIDMLANGLAD